MTTERWLTPIDIALLGELDREPNLVRAARSIGIGRDKAVYRLARLERLYAGPAARGRKGGPTPGETRLTALGRRLLREAAGSHPGGNRWAGVYSRRPSPRVLLDGVGVLEVAFGGRDGSRVEVEVDPEAFVVARERLPLSARNALPVTVEEVRARSDGTAELRARWQGRSVRAALTSRSAVRLGLVRGRRAFLYVKAVAVRRLASRGSPRS